MPLITLGQLKTAIQSIQKILGLKADKTDIKQPDWEQSNSTANDFIQNKPFGDTVDFNCVIVPETTYLINSSTGWTTSGTFGIPIVGETYEVIFGDIVTEKVAKQGNIGIQIGDSWNEFIIQIRADGTSMYVETGSTGNKIIKITGPGCTIKKIDEKYLPDTVANQSDVDDALALKANQSDVDDALNGKMDKNNPIGTGSFSMGRRDSTIIGNSSHAEGSDTTASGSVSHAEGMLTTASGGYSHAEGFSTTASSHCSHAEGSDTTASGSVSHAEGYCTKASGDYSHAEGYNTTASGNYSHAEGYCTKASGRQHVQGKYNIEDADGVNCLYVHIVGNGTSDDARSNAHTLDWSGNAWYAGDVYVGSTSGINKDDGSKKLATEEYVDTAVANINSGTDSSITVDFELSDTSENPVQNKVITAAVTAINAVPSSTAADNDKILMVVDGVPTWVAITNAEGVAY